MTINIECEKCADVVATRDAEAKRESYRTFATGAVQTGMSKKYPGYLATYCKKHAKFTK